MKRFAGGICCFCVFVLFSACVSADHAMYESYLASGNYAEARKQLEANKKRIYAGTDLVLYNLDAGMLSRFGGDYEFSNKELAEAERLMEYYYAKSLTQTIASCVLNDLVIDYAGEDYEDIYTNLFMALNYIQQNKIEAAFVEIRRFDNKLKLLASKYEQAIYEAKQEAERHYAEISSQSLADDDFSFPLALEFHNSAFARYISLLLYRSEGKMDSALVDKKYLESAFQTQSSLYPFSVPESIQQEFSIPKDQGRLNVLCFTGRAPSKREEVFRIPNPVSGAWLKIAVPVMEKKPSKISYVEIQAAGEDGKTGRAVLELLESIENIAEDTFRQKQALVYAKTLARALSKTVGSTVLSTAVSAQDEGNGSMNAVGDLVGFLSGVLIEATEIADTRCSRCFPANVWAGGLNVESGVYTVRVDYYDRNKRLLFSETKENIKVTGKSVSIAEFICMN